MISILKSPPGYCLQFTVLFLSTCFLQPLGNTNNFDSRVGGGGMDGGHPLLYSVCNKQLARNRILKRVKRVGGAVAAEQ